MSKSIINFNDSKVRRRKERSVSTLLNKIFVQKFVQAYALVVYASLFHKSHKNLRLEELLNFVCLPFLLLLALVLKS